MAKKTLRGRARAAAAKTAAPAECCSEAAECAAILPHRRGVKKVVLAYSGGLDTSVIVRWLIENYGCEVVCFSADLGQGEELKPLRKKAIATGASKIVIRDLREEFVQDFILPALKANALYEGKYPMHTSLGRPLIAKHLIDIAHEEGADAIAHGCTGKGNDQCRFEFTNYALDPKIRCLAPVREWELKTRDDEIDYAAKYKIPVGVTKKKPYSIDKNLYGCAIECGVLEDLQNEPPDEVWQDIVDPLKAPNKPEEVAVGFEKGVPVSVNGRAMSALKVIEKLAAIGNKHGVGRLDVVENRLVGIKSREVYEAPASTILIAAHKELESMCLDRDTARFKELIGQRFTDIIYNGTWYTPLREALQAFIERTQATVTGEIVVRLYKGSITVVRRFSPYSLYDKSLATYDEGDQFRHDSALGFIDIFGLPMRIHAAVAQRAGKKTRAKRAPAKRGRKAAKK